MPGEEGLGLQRGHAACPCRRHRLPASTRTGFTPLDPLDGRNVGRILAWMFR